MAVRTLSDTRKAIRSKDAELEVFGLGYVGFPLAVRLALAGMKVTGIDMDGDRLDRLKRGVLHDTEQNLEGVFFRAREEGRLRLSTAPKRSRSGKVGLVCVPTPTPTGSEPSDVHVNAATYRFLENSDRGDVLVVESSVEVGTTDKVRSIVGEAGYHPGLDFGLAFCPERIDPQNTRWTLENIPRIIYCSDDVTYGIASDVYANVNGANLLRVSSAKTAEVAKSFENAFRLVNISLVNELAVLCDSLGISTREVVDAASTKPFGFMPFYPGAGAGGHCVPKDPIFLSESSKKAGGKFRTIENALETNMCMPGYIASSIDALLTEMGLLKSVLVCGMSYKPDTEDMRDSPGFKVADALAGMGYRVGAYDPFFKQELLPKYLKENGMQEQRFDVANSVSVEGFSCLCVVQHHSKISPQIQETYAKGTFPVVYDCQNRIREMEGTPTVLKCLGS